MAAPPKGTGRKPGLLTRMVTWVVRTIWRIVWWVGTRTALLIGGLIAISTLYVHSQLPPVEELLDGRDRGSVTLMDRHGEVFAWRGEQGGVLYATDMSPHLLNAVVAVEDKRFYAHFGISPRGIASAIRINLREGRGPLSGHGGSTITQQVAKLVFLSDQPTRMRKVLEVPYAFAMELKYSKDEILSIYLNRAFLGAGSNGFDAAARRYFGKSAREVSPAESAMLAGLLTAPSRFAPTRNLDRAQNRGALVLGLMHDQGYLTDAQYADARANPAELSRAAAARAGGAYADWIMETGPAFLTRATRDDIAVETTFDPVIQRAAEAALAEVFDELVREGSEAQAAIVVMSRDGAVRAMVGGRDTGRFAGQFNRATQARRQPGSAFKPFVYAAALEAGMNPTDVFMDAPLTITTPGSGPWSPQNYTRDYIGPVEMHEAFARSTNTVAVRVSEDVGRNAVREVARDLGWLLPLADGPALALGVSETTLLTLTGAYAAFLNEGVFVSPFGLTEVRLRGDDAAILSASGRDGVQALRPDTARKVTWMMTQTMDAPYGTGRRARLTDRPTAGKTGTTQEAKDAWFVGFTGQYVAGVWMGYDDNTPLRGVTGGGLPAEIWRRTMTKVHDGLPVEPLPVWQGGVRVDTGGPRPREIPYPGPSTTPRSDDSGVITNLFRSIFGQ
ncbi:penicillin-binding protein 1A [Rubricella aquisinus]|uniref:peptidoglycan glycosyltransferase n=1 Tax=Rubricella aquisinus TaxID=2028108 RepID=A0A840WR29_9RHOB|nr:PBP1A family penicillin-binding protein [Rubricella aquisinus]MBB5517191.1 penicillin-binding protein 1A [Rubricella aquisinus]